MLAVHLENLLFLLLLVVAGLFQLLGRAARKAKTEEPEGTSKPPPRTRKPIPGGSPDSDQDRIRKLLEALGQPSASPQPKPVANRPTYRKPLVLPRVRPLASPLPPLITRPPELPSELEVGGEATRPFSDQPQPLAPLTEARFQVHEAVAPPQPTAAVAAATVQEPPIQPGIATPSGGIDVIAFLRSASGRRDAIIVREILGPPRGLQANEIGT